MGHAILERVLLFGTRSADYIRASGHNGCIATEVILQATTEAEYMTAPERFADSQIPLAPRAPSIHDPFAAVTRCRTGDAVDNKTMRCGISPNAISRDAAEKIYEGRWRGPPTLSPPCPTSIDRVQA